MTPEGSCLTTSIPQRLDRLPWSAWHRKMVIALGITWLLDGLEVTMAGALASILKEPAALGLSNVQVGAVRAVRGYIQAGRNFPPDSRVPRFTFPLAG